MLALQSGTPCSFAIIANRFLLVSAALAIASFFVAPQELAAQVTPNVGSGSVAAACRQRITAGTNRFACGSSSVATGNQSTAVGVGARAIGNASTALGENAQATGTNSVALGRGSVANVANVVSIGTPGAERRIINVSAGTVAAGSTDAVNGNQLYITNQNVTALQANVTTLQGDVAALQSADATLQSNIDAEAATRASADATLQSNIDAEAATRGSADATLQSNVNVERNDRIAADAQLAQHFTTVSQGLATEQGQRLAADAALDNRLSILTGSLADIDSRFEQLDNRVASGTAVATAMSGNSFLPDTKFNLTGNVATYGGAYAAALQVGAVVSRRAAVNAGLATGFNKGGKTAARVGLTIGW